MYHIPMITIDDFAKVEARLGKVLKAEAVEGSDKLIRFELDFGLKSIPLGHTEVLPEPSDSEEISESPVEERDIRVIFSGIKKWHTEPEKLVGKMMLFCTNLEPRKMMGQESHGMLMAVDGLEGQPVFLVPDQEVKPGARIH